MTFVENIAGVFSVQLYDSASCDAIIKYAERSRDWSDASVGEERNGTHRSAIRRKYRAAQSFSPPYRSKLTREFDAKLNSLVKPFIRRVWRVDLSAHSGTHIVKYSPGGFYVTHADAGLDVIDRYFTVLCYLNEDFEGGHTNFPSLDWRITPQKGMAVIFPSTYLHCAEPVLTGQKYILVTWLTGENPIDCI
jgi:predicted 2-oxoglutarate/Fe(II)-dependent dioxygenase YbiX